MAFAKLLRNLLRDEGIGRRVVPIIPDEARTFGMDPLFKEVGIYSALGQRYDPVDSNLDPLLSRGDRRAGARGGHHRGRLDARRFQAAGTSYATHAEPMIPFYIFYSMFGFQRTGDELWAFGDARGRGFLLGGTAGRTTLNGEGLQHEDGHSLVLASHYPPARVYDPAFAYETAAIIRDGLARMYGDAPEDVFYYLALYNENHVMPARPEGVTDEDIVRGLYRFRPGRRGGRRRATRYAVWRRGRSCSRPSRRRTCSPNGSGSSRTSAARRHSSSCATRRWRSSTGTCATPGRRRACRS